MEYKFRQSRFEGQQFQKNGLIQIINRGIKIIVAILPIALFLLLPSAVVKGETTREIASSEWPQFQRDNRHTGNSPHIGVTSYALPQLIKEFPWSNCQWGDGFVEAADGTLYLTSCDRLVAMNPVDGTILWTASGNETSYTTPAVAEDGTIYWGFGDTFRAYTPTGDYKWGWTNLSGNPVFGGGIVIAEDGIIYFSHDGLFSFTKDGDPRWVYRYHNASQSTPAIGIDGTIYVCAVGVLYAFDPDGEVREFYRGCLEATLSIGSDGTLYVGTHDGVHLPRFTAFKPDGTILWEFATSYDYVAQSPVFSSDGTIYFGAHSWSDFTHIFALNPDGTQKWKFDVPAGSERPPGIWAPLVVDRAGNVFACADNGRCYGIDDNGNRMWEAHISSDTDRIIRHAPYITADGEILIYEAGYASQRLYRIVPITEIPYKIYLPLATKE